MKNLIAILALAVTTNATAVSKEYSKSLIHKSFRIVNFCFTPMTYEVVDRMNGNRLISPITIERRGVNDIELVVDDIFDDLERDSKASSPMIVMKDGITGVVISAMPIPKLTIAERRQVFKDKIGHLYYEAFSVEYGYKNNLICNLGQPTVTPDDYNINLENAFP